MGSKKQGARRGSWSRGVAAFLSRERGGRARTIADLVGHDGIAPEHVAEAIQYRGLDRATRR